MSFIKIIILEFQDNSIMLHFSLYLDVLFVANIIYLTSNTNYLSVKHTDQDEKYI